ncbi:hypothetical protein A2U01_0105822, partial [Trifolium medium]|nr:hypothetical protein [Trifolium medium]
FCFGPSNTLASLPPHHLATPSSTASSSTTFSYYNTLLLMSPFSPSWTGLRTPMRCVLKSAGARWR